MKKHLIILCLLLGLVGTRASAYDFEVDGIYYEIWSETSCKVTSGDFEYSNIVTIPNSVYCGDKLMNVIGIGVSAFSGCTDLTSITLPNSVTSIGEQAFVECKALTCIIVDEGNKYYDSRDECNAIIHTMSNKLIAGCQSTVIPNSVTSIGDGAFAYCSSLTSITLPNSVKKIGDYAFYDCSSLTSITLPNSVTSIGDYAFYGCSSLTITLPNSVTSIGDGAFAYCSSLTSITLPNSVTSIGDDAFYDCSSLTNITIPNSVTSIGDYAFYDCSSLTSITLPNSLTSIGIRAFSKCTGLTSITLPNSVTSIGDDAFDGCNNLKTVYNYSLLNIEKGSTNYGDVAYYATHVINKILAEEYIDGFGFAEINGTFHLVDYKDNDTNLTLPEYYKDKKYVINSAFINNSHINSITIPNSVTGIVNHAFLGCIGLTNITIPNSVTSIGNGAFSGCTGLTSITLPNSVTSIGNGVFEGCTNLMNVTIGNSVTSIGDNAFYGCIGLTSITIPNSVTSIEKDAFRNCTNLTDITIGNAIEVIGDHAFEKCENLKSITIAATTPPAVGSHFLTGTVLWTTVVRVPQGSLAAYQTDDFWKSFRNIEEFDVTSIEDVQMDTHNTIAPIYTLQGVQVKEEKENLPAGIYIQGGKKFIVK